MRLESKPPLRKAPSGASVRMRFSTTSSSKARTRSTACSASLRGCAGAAGGGRQAVIPLDAGLGVEAVSGREFADVLGRDGQRLDFRGEIQRPVRAVAVVEGFYAERIPGHEQGAPPGVIDDERK